MKRKLGAFLIVIGVIANNLVYLQDLWLGQNAITLDSWRAYGAILVSLAVLLVGLILLVTERPES